MDICATSLESFTALLQQQVPFTFSRWGDGEWNSILGRKSGANCDGHSYFPQMGEQLRDVLCDEPSYYLGMQPLARRLFGAKIDNWLASRFLTELRWYDADVFHKASGTDRLQPFLQALRQRAILLVGPDHLKRLKPLVPYRAFVDVPPRNAWLAMPRIQEDILAQLHNATEPYVVSLSAGMPAEIILHAVHKRFGVKHTVIDFGSLWDPYVGVKSRGYMRKESHDSITQRTWREEA